MKWFNIAMKKYLDFEGRARRQEYWMFTLFNWLYSIALTAIAFFLLGLTGSEVFFGLPVLYSLAIFIPSISITFRRLHDINKSAAWILLCLIPLIGALWLLILFVIEGDHGENQYGPDPKAIEQV